MDLVRAVAPDCKVEQVGIRAGEKLHEVLISEDEARQTVESDEAFVVQPDHSWWNGEETSGKALPDGFRYGSDNNPRWLSVDDLRGLIATAG